MSLNGKEMAKQLWDGFIIAMQTTVIDLPGDFDIALWMLLILIAFVIGGGLYIKNKLK
jgi:hypothetical protein